MNNTTSHHSKKSISLSRADIIGLSIHDLADSESEVDFDYEDFIYEEQGRYQYSDDDSTITFSGRSWGFRTFEPVQYNKEQTPRWSNNAKASDTAPAVVRRRPSFDDLDLFAEDDGGPEAPPGTPRCPDDNEHAATPIDGVYDRAMRRLSAISLADGVSPISEASGESPCGVSTDFWNQPVRVNNKKRPFATTMALKPPRRTTDDAENAVDISF